MLTPILLVPLGAALLCLFVPSRRAMAALGVGLGGAAAFGAAVLLLGLWIPQGLNDVLQEAARALSKGF
jgi:hypothetical protein